ncbi:fibronectin type III domain-containing protein [Leucobacter luti]|uniref:Fibronectin type III domain protein n=1 Tax=Leucobacter luti TaxID=340320 RepID=A0A4Q7U4Z7_9MICO|nr:fibronectin type III domain-containing protein [Leucobacter luti]MBL3701064.1 hypothetical protein [Leucobacter luti]RZT68714.1 fibronectin type III domain protein [Leucobacter luti]
MLHTRVIGGLTVATMITSATVFAPQPAAAFAQLPDGKAEGSGEYGLIGDSLKTIDSIYGVALDDAGSIWYAVPDGAGRGITEYRAESFDPAAGDYTGNGEYTLRGGYLASAWSDPVHYANRDSTAADPGGGTQPWPEPRGIEPLPGGGIAVGDTNGNVSTPPGTILFYDAEHTAIIGNAGVGGDQGCTRLAEGELAWGPYFAVTADRLYAPYEGCNVVSVFSVPEGDPLHRLTGAGQTAGIQPNPPADQGPGSLDEVYGVSTDGTALYTSDLGFTRAPATGMVQRWLIDDETESWELDTAFGTDGALAFPGEQIYGTVAGADGDLYVIPQRGPVRRYDAGGTYRADVQVRDVPYAAARDLQVTDEGWIVMTARGEHSLRVLAKSPDPVTGLAAESGQADGSVELTWDALEAGYGQAPLLDYVVERSDDGGATWQTVEREISLDPAATLTGLDAGEYDIRVTAFSEAGRGDPALVEGVTVTEPTPGGPRPPVVEPPVVEPPVVEPPVVEPPRGTAIPGEGLPGVQPTHEPRPTAPTRSPSEGLAATGGPPSGPAAAVAALLLAAGATGLVARRVRASRAVR